MTININLNDATDPFGAIDENEYTLECQEAELTESKAGDAMAKFAFQVIGHPEHSGHTIFENCVLEGKGQRFGVWRLRRLCEAMDVELGPVDEIDWDEFQGKTFQAHVEKTPPSGEYGEGNRIKEVLI